MNRYEIKRWIREHKVEILVCGFEATMVGFAVALGIKARKSGKPVLGIVHEIKDVNVKLDTATVTEAWTELGGVNMILNDFKVSDIGKLGEDLIKNIPNVTEDTTVSCIKL